MRASTDFFMSLVSVSLALFADSWTYESLAPDRRGCRSGRTLRAMRLISIAVVVLDMMRNARFGRWSMMLFESSIRHSR
jgi:hypothetical protein